MSDADSGPGRREVAYRLFAAAFDDADYTYSESDEERAPNYVLTPTGARVNRLFAVGVLTEIEQVNESMLRARVVDPTGAFVLYAGQYQPDALSFLERAEPPAFLAVTGKARTFEPEDGDRVYTSVRPETLNEVDADTRDRWVVEAAEHTVERVGTTAGALETGLAGEELRAALAAVGVEPGLAAGIPLALDHYGTTPTYLEAVRETAVDAARVVAGDLDEVPERGVAPDKAGEATAASLADPGVAEATVPPGADVDRDERATTPETDELTGESEAPGPEAEPGGSGTAEAPTGETGAAEAESEAVTETRGGSPESEGPSPEEPGDVEGEAFDLDAETRREVEAEHGVEFSTGSEVDEPGEADAEESEPTETTPSSSRTSAPADLEDAVVDAMTDLDDGDGADREAVVDEVATETGVDADAVESAIEGALKAGRCYEPEEGRLKSI